jgi:hypothetical protein
MALSHLGITETQKVLNEVLGLTPAGVPASRLLRLDRYGVQVLFQKGMAEDIKNAIDLKVPVIVFVSTAPLPYWTVDTQHALLVSGYDEETFMVNDPAFSEPRHVSTLELVLAWDEFDNRYALLRKRVEVIPEDS